MLVSLARNDEVDITVPGRETWSPWIGCVFTYPEYRGQRLSEKLISLAEEYAINGVFYRGRYCLGRTNQSFAEEVEIMIREDCLAFNEDLRYFTKKWQIVRIKKGNCDFYPY